MGYQREIDFHGSPKKALDFGLQVLAQQDFLIEQRNECEFVASGRAMANTKRHPLTGASRVKVRASRGRLEAAAEFGGLRRLMMFLCVFLLLLAAFLFILLNALHEEPGILWTPLAPFIPWPALLPVIWFAVRRRTAKALDRLLENMRTMAETDR